MRKRRKEKAMYKSKFFCWIGIIILFFAVRSGYQFFSTHDFSRTEYTMYSEITDSSVLSRLENISGGGFSGYILKNSMDGTDIIIREHSDEEMTGYVRHEKLIFTPIVMYIQGVSDKASGFSYEYDGDSQTLHKNFYEILTAFEKGMAYSDIGISDKILSGEIKIAMPNETSVYYDTVVDFIYTTINNGKYPSEEEKTALKERADALIGKIKKIGDLKSECNRLYYAKDVKSDTIYLWPEVTAIKGNANNSSDYIFGVGKYVEDKSFYVVYPDSIVAKFYDVYIKEDVDEGAYHSITKSDMPKETGLRISGEDGPNYGYILKTLTTRN